MISLFMESRRAAVGEVFRGTVALSSRHKLVPRLINISIQFSASGRGLDDQGRVNTVGLKPDRAAISENEPIPFEILVPWRAPITYNGKLFRVSWKMEVVVFPTSLIWPLSEPRRETAFYDIQVTPRNLS